MNPNAAFPFFFVFWILLCIALWTFYWKGSLEAKRRWHPRLVFGVAVVFLGFIAMALPFALLVAIPVVGLISFMNLKMLKFCPACGRTLIQQPPWAALNFCSKCGANLQQQGGA